MLILLLLFALFRTLKGVPLSPPAAAPDSFSNLTLRDTQNHFGQRTVNDIVISCFATIFACTWTAIHPNIPAPTDCWWTRFKRQVTILLCALLAPELITIWALRQRLAAKSIMDEYNREIIGESAPENGYHSILNGIRVIPHAIGGLFHDSPALVSSTKAPQWTLSHGFFLQMGGFMLSDYGQPIQTLYCSQMDPDEKPIPDDKQLIYCIRSGSIEPPRITREDIQDRSKGNAISKIFIVLQTTWFMVQCLARWTQHLPVTELEIITLGFAMLNGIIYALWWHKPQNVGYPVFLQRNILQCSSTEIVHTPHVADFSAPAITESEEQDLDANIHQHATNTESDPSPKDTVGPEGDSNSIDTESISTVWVVLLFPCICLVLPFVPALKGLGKLLSVTSSAERVHRVPIFYTAYTGAGDLGLQILVTFPIIGVIFGSVHLIPSWFLDFSSRQEMWLWRVSALIITALPILLPVLSMLAGISSEYDCDILKIIFTSLVAIVLILYPFARIILLILSLTSLRSIPPAALQTIEWTTFIPHL